ncbi:transposase [Paraburkholderia atlantica]
MDHATLVGIDLGKHSFHLHGQDRNGKAVFRTKLGRKQLVEFFATTRPAPSSWKRAPALITWLASWPHLATRSS